MSYNKKIIRKIRIRRMILALSICIVILLITTFIGNFQNSKKRLHINKKLQICNKLI